MRILYYWGCRDDPIGLLWKYGEHIRVGEVTMFGIPGLSQQDQRQDNSVTLRVRSFVVCRNNEKKNFVSSKAGSENQH